MVTDRQAFQHSMKSFRDVADGGWAGGLLTAEELLQYTDSLKLVTKRFDKNPSARVYHLLASLHRRKLECLMHPRRLITSESLLPIDDFRREMVLYEQDRLFKGRRFGGLGITVSVQASDSNYSTPRKTWLKLDVYTHFEVAFMRGPRDAFFTPTALDPLFKGLAITEQAGVDVLGYVPVHVIQECLAHLAQKNGISDVDPKEVP